MKKLTYSLLLLMLLTSVPALADYAPVNVQTALKKMYPAAKDVAWSRDETYYVADRMVSTQRSGSTPKRNGK